MTPERFPVPTVATRVAVPLPSPLALVAFLEEALRMQLDQARRLSPLLVPLAAISMCFAHCGFGCSMGPDPQQDTRSGLERQQAEHCRVKASIKCPLACSQLDFDSFCDATLGAGCDNQCDTSATGTCLDKCNADCAIGCQANAITSCDASCHSLCGDNCTKICVSAQSPSQCADTCREECHLLCGDECTSDADSSCEGTCGASCNATCSVEAHVACNLRCSVAAWTTCKANVQANCMADCSADIMLTCADELLEDDDFIAPKGNDGVEEPGLPPGGAPPPPADPGRRDDEPRPSAVDPTPSDAGTPAVTSADASDASMSAPAPPSILATPPLTVADEPPVRP